MIAITALLPLLIGFFMTLAEAQQRVSEKVHEGAIYLRMMLFAIAGALMAMGLAEYIGLLSVLASLVSVSLVLLVSHLVAKKLALGGFATGVNNVLQRIYLAWEEVFRLFQLPAAPDPEEFEKEFLEKMEVEHQDVLKTLKEGNLTEEATQTIQQAAKDVASNYS